MIGLGQSYKRVSKCYFLCVKGPRGGKQGLSHFLFPPLWVKLKTCKLITVFSAYYMLKLYQCFTDQLSEPLKHLFEVWNSISHLVGEDTELLRL